MSLDECSTIILLFIIINLLFIYLFNKNSNLLKYVAVNLSVFNKNVENIVLMNESHSFSCVIQCIKYPMKLEIDTQVSSPISFYTEQTALKINDNLKIEWDQYFVCFCVKINYTISHFRSTTTINCY